MNYHNQYQAAFIDRDGVINLDKGYTYKVKDLSVYNDAYDGLIELQKHGFKLFIITNQSGIARGFYSINQFKCFMDALIINLASKGVHIDDYFYCPHHIDGNVKEFSIKCDCRKPSPGLIHQAMDKYNIDLERSILIGDKNSDIEAGLSAGIQINIKINRDKEYAYAESATYNVSNMIDAAKLITDIHKSNA
jgi:D-glycero-D-manno-heptose 1,7-bisphosphate phosphatase